MIYVIIGIIVAWDRGYITVLLLKLLLSALLAIWLWWLVLLGVSLHSLSISGGYARDRER